MDYVVDGRVEELVVVHRHFHGQAFGQIGLDFIDYLEAVFDNLCRIRARALEHDGHGGGIAIATVGESVCHTAEFDFGHVFEAEHFAVAACAHHDFAELLGCDFAAAVAHGVLEALLALLAERAGSGFHVLLGKSRADVGGHEAVLRHHVGLEPYAHGVVGTETHHVTHAAHTLELGDYVDFHVVVEELRGVGVGGVHQRYAHEHRCLSFLREHTHLVYFRREQVGGLCHTVLHVDGRHVGVEALAEVDVDGGGAGVGGRRFHVGHAFGSVD